MLMKVRLHHPAVLQSDLLDQFAHPVDDRALHHMLRGARIVNLTADISRYPDPVDLDFLVGTYGDFGHLRNVAAGAEMARDAERRPRRQLALAPTGLFRYK